MNISVSWRGTLLLILCCTLVLGCKKKTTTLLVDDKTSRVVGVEPILSFKKRWNGKSTSPVVIIQDDISITGQVVANDEAGNFFKEIVLQDQSGAIPLLIDGFGLFGEFPVGRELTIHCKGLALSVSYGIIKLGYARKSTQNIVDEDEDGQTRYLAGIPLAITDEFINKGAHKSPLVPRTIPLNQLGTDLYHPFVSALVRVEGMSFMDHELGKTYADPQRIESGASRNLDNPQDEEISLRNSSYAKFAGKTLPTGQGAITAIFYPFRQRELQLRIRTEDDMDFKTERKRLSNPHWSIRKLLGRTYPIPKGTYIVGKVLSGKCSTSTNSSGKNGRLSNIVISDSTAGIEVRGKMSQPNSVCCAKVDIGGKRIQMWNGSPQVVVDDNAITQKTDCSTADTTSLSISFIDLMKDLVKHERQYVTLAGAKFNCSCCPTGKTCCYSLFASSSNGSSGDSLKVELPQCKKKSKCCKNNCTEQVEVTSVKGYVSFVGGSRGKRGIPQFNVLENGIVCASATNCPCCGPCKQ